MNLLKRKIAIMKSILFVLPLMLFTTALFAQNSLDTCLVSFYTFDTQDISDSRGNNNGQLVAGTYNTDRFGNSSSALKIRGNGSNDIATVGHTLVDPNSDFAVAFWMNVDDFSTPENFQYLVTSRHNASGNEQGGIDISASTSGTINCAIRTPSLGVIGSVTSNAVATNTWHHVVATRNNGILSIYINGVLEASTAVNGLTTPIPAYWTFGAIYNPGPTVHRELDGKIDEIRFYCRSLNTTEITTLYADRSCIVAAYNLDGNGDDRQNGKDGTPVGFVYYGMDRFGVPNHAYKLEGNGTNQLMEVPHTLIDPNQDFTISLWVNIDSFNTPERLQYLVTARNDMLGFGQGGVDVAVDTFGEIRCLIRQANATPTVDLTSLALTAGAWHHIIVRRTGNTLELYVDNVLNDSGAINGSVPIASYWTVGGIYNPGRVVIRELSGRVDDLEFYCTALSPADINGIYLPVSKAVVPKKEMATTLYPNPVKEVLQIAIEGATEPLQAQIISLQGQVLQQQIVQNKGTISVQDIPAGVYFLQLSNETTVLATKKFVKQ